MEITVNKHEIEVNPKNTLGVVLACMLAAAVAGLLFLTWNTPFALAAIPVASTLTIGSVVMVFETLSNRHTERVTRHEITVASQKHQAARKLPTASILAVYVRMMPQTLAVEFAVADGTNVQMKHLSQLRSKPKSMEIVSEIVETISQISDIPVLSPTDVPYTKSVVLAAL